MVKWVDEKVLQKYFIENAHKYYHPVSKLKIISAQPNRIFDLYPDIFCTLEDKKEVPVEVEWKTSDFNHDLSILKENNGFIVVLHQDDNFELGQIKIIEQDFKIWFIKNADRLLTESLRDVRKEDTERKYPKLWFIYLNRHAYNNYQKTVKQGVWGMPTVHQAAVLNRFMQVKEGDLVAFVGPWFLSHVKNNKKKTGRVPLQKFKGKIEQVSVFEVKKDYYYSDKEVWQKKKGQLWPHRFEFDPNPILKIEDILINKLSYTSRASLHQLIYQMFWEGSPNALVEIMSIGKSTFKK